MGHFRTIDPVLLVVAAFTRHPEALTWAQEHLEQALGPLALASLPFDFTQTRYYESTMGVGLRKCFLVFRELIAPERLADIKHVTNELEATLARSGIHAEPRPLNLDPGVLTLGKFLLATTKDQSHRVYLREGIHAEVTLRFQAGTFEPWPWTYADYRQPEVLAFLNDARNYYRGRLRAPMLDAEQ